MATEEDEDFVKEFESLLKTEENAAAYNTGKNSDLTVPLSAKKQIENESEKQEGKRVFALVTRKGTKTNVQALQIDEDSRLAQGLEAAEKERLKAKEVIFYIKQTFIQILIFFLVSLYMYKKFCSSFNFKLIFMRNFSRTWYSFKFL